MMTHEIPDIDLPDDYPTALDCLNSWQAVDVMRQCGLRVDKLNSIACWECELDDGRRRVVAAEAANLQGQRVVVRSGRTIHVFVADSGGPDQLVYLALRTWAERFGNDPSTANAVGHTLFVGAQ